MLQKSGEVAFAHGREQDLAERRAVGRTHDAGASDELRPYSLDLLEHIVALAGDLGVPGVIIGPGKSNPLYAMPREHLIGHFFRALDRLAPLAKRAGTSLYVENMPFAFLPAIDELLAGARQLRQRQPRHRL